MSRSLEYRFLMAIIWRITSDSARELRDSRLATDFMTLDIDGINPNLVMRWTELRSVLQHLDHNVGQVYDNEDSVKKALFDAGGGFGISWMLAAGVLEQLQSQEAPDKTGDYVLPERLPPGVAEKLGVYVYVLLDPRDRSIFYVGKGVSDRVYSHIWSAMGKAQPIESSPEIESAAVKSAKNQRIYDIYHSGAQVEHFILRHQIAPEATSDQSAFAIEQTLIDALRLLDAPGMDAVLANIAGGHTATQWGVIPLTELILRYAAAPAPEIDLPFVVLVVNFARKPNVSAEEIYEESRGWWKAGPRARNTVDIPIFIIAADIVRAVHRASSWEQGEEGKWRFTGPVDRDLESRYVGTSLAELKKGRSNGKWNMHGWHPYI